MEWNSQRPVSRGASCMAWSSVLDRVVTASQSGLVKSITHWMPANENKLCIVYLFCVTCDGQYQQKIFNEFASSEDSLVFYCVQLWRQVAEMISVSVNQDQSTCILQYIAYTATCLLLHCAGIKGGPLELPYMGHASSKLINKKAVLVHRTPREAKTVYPIDWMRKF